MTNLEQNTDFSRAEFSGANGNTLRADIFEAAGNVRGQVILAHGGGQTRHSWRGTARALARLGWRSITLDQRGHGDSDWVADGDYSFDAFAADLAAVARALSVQGRSAPVVVGASLGGIAGLVVGGEHAPDTISGLVLVDITPIVKADGVERILGFMASRAKDGFATLEEAADAISAYLPHRPRPKDLSGLAKNLRLGSDGRYRWHWDPRFLDSRRDSREHVVELQTKLQMAAGNLTRPVLLVRGRESELVGEAEARAFAELVPHAKIADVSGARHMVAGDKNDVFSNAVVDFLEDITPLAKIA